MSVTEVRARRRQIMEMAEVGGRATLTIEETARLIGLGRTAAYEAARRGELPTLRIGRRPLVPVPALLELLRSAPTPR